MYYIKVFLVIFQIILFCFLLYSTSLMRKRIVDLAKFDKIFAQTYNEKLDKIRKKYSDVTFSEELEMIEDMQKRFISKVENYFNNERNYFTNQIIMTATVLAYTLLSVFTLFRK